MALSDDWYKDAVVYSVDVETFLDADGDGVGDFQGLISRLDYLARLGVDTLWLLPFYPTPNRDNGYDVKSYYGVDERLGTLGDFVEFVHEAKSRGFRVITDIVLNHTSDQHPWFQSARRDPDSKYRDYYVWTDDPSKAPEKGLVFPGEEEDVWTYDEVADAYYYHRFYHFQPDLNIANPAVREELRKVLGFWLELGVDGFRIDAATLMIDQKGTQPRVFDDPHEVFKLMKRFVRSRSGEAVFLAEADDEPEKLVDYFGEERDEMDLMLNFVLNAHVGHALAVESGDPLRAGLDRLERPPDHGRWANFLRNYDEMNLGRLSEADQEEVYEQFAPEEYMRIYDRGIRRRIATMLDGDVDRLELAYSLLFSLPGVPIVVSGDEIGMGDDLDLPGRNAVRTPMHWSDTHNAGFSDADPSDLVRPVIEEGPYGYDAVNVADQRPDPDSLLNRVARLIHTRREYREFTRGTHEVLATNADGVFAHGYRWEGNVVAAVHNLSGEPESAALRVETDAEHADKLVGDAAVDEFDGETCRVSLGPYEYCWVRTGEVRHQLPPFAAAEVGDD